MRETIFKGCFLLVAILMAAQTALAQIVINRNSVEDFFNSEFSVFSAMSSNSPLPIMSTASCRMRNTGFWGL